MGDNTVVPHKIIKDCKQILKEKFTLYTYRSIIHTSQKVQATQASSINRRKLSTDSWTNKMPYTHTMEYYSVLQRKNCDTCYNMDKHWGYYTKWKKPLYVQFSSVAQLCPTLCNTMDCSTPGFPVQNQLPEFTQAHVLWVSDAIQPSHPLSFPSPLTFNLSQHQGLFQWVSSSHEVAKVLEFQPQHQSFQQTPWSDLL